jgi:hypothetical protein
LDSLDNEMSDSHGEEMDKLEKDQQDRCEKQMEL